MHVNVILKKKKKKEKRGWKIHLARVKCIATVRVKIRSGNDDFQCNI